MTERGNHPTVHNAAARPEPILPVLRLENISKRFGATLANENITVELRQGELLALLGENGAGKTTLMNILFGHYVPDEGRVLVHGRELPPGRPRAAIEAGVGMVHQHFTLAGNLTVLENVMAGTESLWAWRSGRAATRRRLVELAQKFGLAVEPDARVGELSVGERQRVEILKALFNDAKILILDEPTAVLTQAEAEKLFETLRAMAEHGLSLIFISHKLQEVLAAADRIVVLRGGRTVAERRPAETGKDELAELIVGRRIARPVREAASSLGETVAEADNVDVTVNGAKRLSGISFSVRAGETLGIIGVSGNGQAALAQLLSGLTVPERGTLRILGETLGLPQPRRLVERGVGRVPEDRHAEGAIGDLAVWENAVLERAREPRFSRWGFLRRRAARAFTGEIAARFDIRGAGVEARTRLLSGGNMQKLILGRNLATLPKLLVAAQPTRGLDEGAIAAVHREILFARAGGAAVILISEDLDEVLALADRAQAIHKGRLSPSVPAEELDARRLGLMMAGEWGEAAA